MGELSWQKALEIDALGYPGDGDMHVVGPLSFVAGEDGQELYLQVENLSHSPGSWTVRAEGPLLDGPWSAEVPIAGSTPTELASRVVAIPLKEDPPAGEFDIDLALEGKGGVQEELTHRMYVFELDDAQRAILLDQARSGEVEEDPLAVEQLIRVLTRGDSGTNADTTAPTIEFGELTSTSVSGTTEAGASVTVRDASDAVLAGVEAGPDGVFFAGFAEQAAGSAITVEAVDVAGNSSGRIELVIGQPPPSGASSLSPSSSSSAASGSAASKPGGSGLVFTGASVAGAGVVAAALLAFGTVMIARRRTARKTRLAEGDA
jgi:hypothetical protein